LFFGSWRSDKLKNVLSDIDVQSFIVVFAPKESRAIAKVVVAV